MEQGINGRFIIVEANDPNNTTGKRYKLYIPNNVDSSTKMHVYLPGQDGNSLSTVKDNLLKNGCDSIVVFPISGNYIDGSVQSTYSPKNMEILDNVAKIYGGDNQNVTVSGVSTGGLQSLFTACEGSTGKYSSKITGCAYLDSTQTQRIEDQQLQSMANSNITLYINSDCDAAIGKQAAIRYAKMGGTVIFTDYGAEQTKGHNYKCNEPYGNNLIDFLNGTRDLTNKNDNGTEFQRRYFTYDKNGNEIEISYEEVKKLIGNNSNIASNDFSKLTPSFESLKKNTQDLIDRLKNSYLSSDNEFLINNISTLLQIINNTTFLKGISNNDYQSTVSTLPAEDELIAKYFSITTSLLEKITKEEKNFLIAGNIIEDTNENLQQTANQALNTGGSYPGGGNIIATPDETINQEPLEEEPVEEEKEKEEEQQDTPNTNTSSQETWNNSQNNLTNETSQDTPNEEDNIVNEPTEGYIPISKEDNAKDKSTAQNETTNNSNNQLKNTTTTTKNSNGMNPLGIILGAGALGGVGYAGKKIYDKQKENDDE